MNCLSEEGIDAIIACTDIHHHHLFTTISPHAYVYHLIVSFRFLHKFTFLFFSCTLFLSTYIDNLAYIGHSIVHTALR